MGIILAILFLALAILALIIYGGTPHGGPTTTCGPINVFSHTYTMQMDCRYLSAGELVAAGVLFFFCVVAALSTRPRSQ